MNKKESVTKFIKGCKKVVIKRSPEILMALGVTGMITSTVLAVKATKPALKVLEEKEEEKGEELTKVEVVKATYKYYLPAVVTSTVSVACIIGSSSVNARRNAALATAYQLSSSALSEYKEKVVETIGEKKEKAIREKIAQDKINDEKTQTTPMYIVDTNATDFLDPIGGVRFVANIEKVRAAVNTTNAMLLDNDFVSLNDFYYELGLPPTKMGYKLGWDTKKGRRESLIDIHFGSCVENGKAYAVLEYNLDPDYDYDKVYV